MRQSGPTLQSSNREAGPETAMTELGQLLPVNRSAANVPLGHKAVVFDTTTEIRGKHEKTARRAFGGSGVSRSAKMCMAWCHWLAAWEWNSEAAPLLTP